LLRRSALLSRSEKEATQQPVLLSSVEKLYTLFTLTGYTVVFAAYVKFCMVQHTLV
jgi:hypothetical protein